MFRQLIFIFFILIFASNAFCQDTLLLNNGKKIIVKVEAISSRYIYYFEMTDSIKLHEYPKNYVSRITYSDGMHDDFFNINLSANNIDTVSNKYNLGKYYAKKYYRRQIPFTIAFLATTLGTVGVTLITEEYTDDNGLPLLIGPLVTSSLLLIKPNSHIAIPDMTLYNDPDFSRGYRKQIRHEKTKSALLGFVSGLAVDIAFVFLINQ